MIRLDVQDYCQQCMDFNPDVDMAQKAYGMSPDGNEIEFVLTDTVVRCRYRKRCESIKRYLDRQKENVPNAENN